MRHKNQLFVMLTLVTIVSLFQCSKANQNNPDENKIIEEGISVLNNLANNKVLLEEVGEKSRIYAEEHFSGKVFCENYSKVLFG